MYQPYGLSDDKNTITIKRFEGGLHKVTTSPETRDTGKGIFLDVETTGLNANIDKIIDLGFVVFEYDKNSGEILNIIEKFSQLQDPKQPLSPIIKKITGYDDCDLEGQSIDWKHVEKSFRNIDIVLAHNANFDRKFLDNALSISKEKVWGCSMSQIDWKNKGHGSRSLEYLCKDNGFFFDGHRALIDAEASTYLISLVDKSTETPLLKELLSKAFIPMKWVYAQGAHFDFKDNLRNRGYQWEPRKRVWRKLVALTNNEEELFIKTNAQAGNPYCEEIRPENNFK